LIKTLKGIVEFPCGMLGAIFLLTGHILLIKITINSLIVIE